MAQNRFSIAAVFLSYLLVAGGIALALVLVGQIGVTGEAVVYGALALGGAIGGGLAARASRGSTVVEPAIGGALVILTLVGVFVGTEAGAFLWHAAKDDIVRTVAIAGGAAAAGAILGAVAVEKKFAGHSTSSVAWLFFTAFAMLGACVVAFIVLLGAIVRGAADDDSLAAAYLGGMAVGSLLTGLTIGASAPRRVLLINLLGVLAGVMGFFLLIISLPSFDGDGEAGKAAAGFVIIGIGCGLIAMLGAAIGWALVGKRHARAADQTSSAFA